MTESTELPEVTERLSKHVAQLCACSRLVKKEGFDVGDMNRRLLEKIEELTLYIIGQDKKLNSLQEQVQLMQSSPKK